MSIEPTPIDAKLAEYVREHASGRDEALRLVEDETEAMGDIRIMQTAPEQAAFLEMLVSLGPGRRAIEVGTFTGYGAIRIARGLAGDGTLLCCELGQAIKDMASCNIFPGDMLLKNFGVTRHGRVVFYDYDELCLLEDCNFRRLPLTNRYEDDLASEPWFHINANDIFPEEFPNFLGLSGRLREEFEHHHGDLHTAEYWRAQQEATREGYRSHIFPYQPEQRLYQENI